MEYNALSIALVAGILATFNPCGFALLPAYLGALVLDTKHEKQRIFDPYWRALRFSFAMAIGLVLVFSIFALVVIPFSLSLQQYLPIVTALIGIVLLVLGVQLFLGKEFLVRQLFNPNVAPKTQLFTQIGYGITFALGSLSCTIGPFVAIASTALASANWLGIILNFATYGMGMGLTVLILAVSVAAANKSLIVRIRNARLFIEKLTAGLVFVVGVYLLIYAAYELQSFQGKITNNPVIDFALSIQTAIVGGVLQVLSWLHIN